MAASNTSWALAQRSATEGPPASMGRWLRAEHGCAFTVHGSTSIVAAVGPCRGSLGSLAEGGGGPRVGDFGEPVAGASGAEPVVELGGGDGPGHVVALGLVAAQAHELGVGGVGLDAFGDHA